MSKLWQSIQRGLTPPDYYPCNAVPGCNKPGTQTSFFCMDDQVFLCKEHSATLHGPDENPYICRQCTQYGFECECPETYFCNQCGDDVRVHDYGTEYTIMGDITWYECDKGHRQVMDCDVSNFME